MKHSKTEQSEEAHSRGAQAHHGGPAGGSSGRRLLHGLTLLLHAEEPRSLLTVLPPEPPEELLRLHARSLPGRPGAYWPPRAGAGGPSSPAGRTPAPRREGRRETGASKYNYGMQFFGGGNCLVEVLMHL